MDKFSLPALIAWLGSKDPNTKYEYSDHKCCLLTQFGIESGLTVESCPYTTIWQTVCESIHDSLGIASPAIFAAVDWNIAALQPRTYGAALKRAKAWEIKLADIGTPLKRIRVIPLVEPVREDPAEPRPSAPPAESPVKAPEREPVDA